MSAAKYARLLIRRDRSRRWYWVFVATNGKVLARSSESYHRRGPCLNAAALVLGTIVPPDMDGQVYFRDNATEAGFRVDDRTAS